MKFLLAAILALYASSTAAQAFDFTGARRWLAICASDMKTMPAPMLTMPPTMQKRVLHLVWDRAAGAAELSLDNGNKKFLRQINDDADYIAHFHFGPDPSSVGADPDIPTIDCCYNSMLSMRASGEYALTTHDIFAGGIKVTSEEGQCTFTRLTEVEIR